MCAMSCHAVSCVPCVPCVPCNVMPCNAVPCVPCRTMPCNAVPCVPCRAPPHTGLMPAGKPRDSHSFSSPGSQYATTSSLVSAAADASSLPYNLTPWICTSASSTDTEHHGGGRHPEGAGGARHHAASGSSSGGAMDLMPLPRRRTGEDASAREYPSADHGASTGSAAAQRAQQVRVCVCGGGGSWRRVQGSGCSEPGVRGGGGTGPVRAVNR